MTSLASISNSDLTCQNLYENFKSREYGKLTVLLTVIAAVSAVALLIFSSLYFIGMIATAIPTILCSAMLITSVSFLGPRVFYDSISFFCQMICHTSSTGSKKEFYASIVHVQDSEKRIFSVIPVYSIEELSHVPKDIRLDYRIKKEDTEQSLSCLRGIALDPNFTRAQIFLINDGNACIGISTLFVVPYKNLINDVYFKKIDKKLIPQSFSKLFDVQPGSFVIETGLMKILPQYRKKKLGKAVLSGILIPAIKELCSLSRKEIILKFSAAGCADKATQELLFKSSGEISISKEMEACLGKVHSEAMFTSMQAGRMQLKPLPDVFNRSLGPVFAKVISPRL